jgi:hypothetical protein
MNTTEFRAAVEKIIGVPPLPPASPVLRWTLPIPHGDLRVTLPWTSREDCFNIHLDLDDGRPNLGENPHTGAWDILARDFNNDPEAVLRELVRRLAAAGYEPPKPVITINPPEHYRKIITEEIERSMMTGEAGTPVFLTEEERQIMRELVENAVVESGRKPDGFAGAMWESVMAVYKSLQEKLQKP